MLAANWDPGDVDVLLHLVSGTSGRAGLHAIADGILEVTRRRGAADLVPAVVLAARRTPCSWCRHGLVSALLEADALPGDLREECRFDCREDTRALVGGEVSVAAQDRGRTIASAATWVNVVPAAQNRASPLDAVADLPRMRSLGDPGAEVAPPDGLEPPTQALGRPRSIH
jgi:hypothetical protein